MLAADLQLLTCKSRSQSVLSASDASRPSLLIYRAIRGGVRSPFFFGVGAERNLETFPPKAEADIRTHPLSKGKL